MQPDYTMEERIEIIHGIRERLLDAMREHWKECRKTDIKPMDEQRENLTYIAEHIGDHARRVHSLLSGADIRNISNTIARSKAANRMTMIWQELIAYTYIDTQFSKNLMDDISGLFENYEVIRAWITYDDSYWKVMVTATMFEVGTCQYRHDERVQTFTGYTVKRPDMAPIFLSAVEYIAWSVDRIKITHNAKDAQ